VGLGCQLGIDQLPVKRWGDRSAAGARRYAATATEGANTAAAATDASNSSAIANSTALALATIQQKSIMQLTYKQLTYRRHITSKSSPANPLKP
jgi:hypothetical protein